MKTLLTVCCLCLFPLLYGEHIVVEEGDGGSTATLPTYPLSCSACRPFRTDLGPEKIVLTFPHKPEVSKGENLFLAYTYDKQVFYSLTAYSPSIADIAPLPFFDQILVCASEAPFHVLNHKTYQMENGHWVLDYAMEDGVKDTIVKTRCIVTPHNAYTLQAIYPNGHMSQFDSFVASFIIKNGKG